MTRPQPTVRRMVGTSDLSWILFVGASATIVTSLLLGHLRVEFETYRVANARAALSTSARTLHDEHRSLELELQHRVDAIEPWSTAESLGLVPPTPQQTRTVEAP
ncbi:MAG: hypothetical protein H6700_02425 [Myxococcales bacterium]|nr:hypothetical protein [Myxococcales bacterium]MCB9530594.1 hypothetical protein [Myxococcales bacterium]